jgi:hypothetical protein
MVLHNLEKIIKVYTNDFYKSQYFQYRKERKWWLFKNEPEGIYRWYGDYVCSVDDFLKKYKNLILKDGVVYEKPECVVVFHDNIKKIMVFDTLEEAKAKAEWVKNKLPTIARTDVW